LIRGPPEYAIQKLKEIIKDRKPTKIITVGDRVSSSLPRKGILPDFMIVDNKVMRRTIPPIKLDADQTFHAKNPPGTITDEAWNTVREALEQEKRVKIVVEGEEDLLTLVAVLFAPENSVVIYGQPHEGVVMIRVTKKTREMVSKLVDEMERQG